MIRLSQWFPRSASPSRSKARFRSFRPGLEALEDRQLLTLTAPVLLAPLVSSSPTPTFSWTPVAGAATYHFLLNNLTTHAFLDGPGLVQTTLTLGAPLVVGDTYQWTVQAVDIFGNPGPWSTVAQVQVTNLTAPTLYGPSGPAAPRPLFSWSPLALADHYEIWVQNQNTGQVLDNTNVQAPSWTPDTPLAQGNVYVWWARGIDGNGTGGPWSSSLTFSESVLPPPTLIGPSGAALPQPTFSWNLVSGADHYDIWIEDLVTYQVIRDTNVGGTTWSPTTPLTPQDNYDWWARAVDPNGYNGQWSAALTFTAYVLPAPSLIGPTVSSATLPTFTWNAVSGADHYDIWVQDMRTGVVLRQTTVNGTTWAPAGPLAQGDPYSWWVRAVNNTDVAGSWSSSLSFTVATLAMPTLVGPSGTDSLLPTFTWNAALGADHYDIWVQDVRSGQVLRDQTVTGTSWLPAAPLTLGDSYRWWVRAVDSVNSPGPWSSSLIFVAYALPATSLIGPSGSSGPLPTFSWNAVAGADHFDIWVQDVRSGQALRDQSVATTTWVPPSPLTPGDSYNWWVRAVNSSGSAGPWSSALHFVAYVLAAPTLIGPSGSSGTLPTFSWNAVTGAARYDIWVNDLTTGNTAVLRNQDVAGTSWTPTTSLRPGDNYRWWLRAVTSGNIDGAWSDSLDFSAAAG
jgi:hypothetical protein